MKLDKDKLCALAALPDAALWARIREIAGARGFHLPEACPSHADMERVRSVLREGERIRMADAMRLINEYRKKGGV